MRIKKIRQLIQNTLQTNGFIGWCFVGDYISNSTYSSSWCNRQGDTSIIVLLEDVRKPHTADLLEFTKTY